MSTLPSIRRSVIAITALLVPLAFTAASANAGYLYVADSDTIPTTEAHVNLPINAQTVSNNTEEHSLFEMSMSNMSGTSGNIIEIGVTTDPGLNGDRNPHWFVSSWINGTWRGYDANSDFVSQIGTFWATSLTSIEGTSPKVAFQYNAPNWWLYLNGAAAGYFPGTEWSGAFTTSSVTDVYGEVYDDGTFYPTLNGTVSGYGSSGGGHLSTLTVDAPYTQSNASQTGFTASGPNVTASGGTWNVNKGGSWMVGGNWTNNTVPNSGTVMFAGVPGFPSGPSTPLTVTLDGPQSAGALVFSVSNGNGYTLSQGTGGALTLGTSAGGSISVLDGAHTISAPVVMAGNLAVSMTSGTSLQISGAVSGSTSAAGLGLSGAGTMTLSAINTYSGGTTVNGGILAAANGGYTTPLGSGNVTVNAGGTLRGDAWDAFGYGVGFSPPLITINGGTVTTEAGGSFYVSLPNIVFNGGGTISSGAGNSGDPLGAYGNVTLYAQGAGTATVSVTNPGVTTALINAGTVGLSAAITNFNVAAGSATSQLTVSSTLKDAYLHASLIKSGLGTMILSGDNTYDGGTIVTGGRLELLGCSALPDGSSLTIGANATSIFGAAAPQTAAPAPEPSTLLLLTVGGVVATAAVCRRRRN